MKKQKALYLNLTIFVLEVICFIWMFSGFNIASQSSFSAKSFASLKYFTVLSNLFAGVMALVYFCFYKSKKKISRNIKILKLSSVTSVCLTLFVTAFFLVPQMGHNFYMLYTNSNFFFHLATPILCIITYVLYEDHYNMEKKDYIVLVSPVIIYEIFYILNIYVHEGIKNITYKYDFYGFTGGNLSNAILVVPIIIIITLFIGFILNKIKNLGK